MINFNSYFIEFIKMLLINNGLHFIQKYSIHLKIFN